jgi:hypothetical protein
MKRRRIRLYDPLGPKKVQKVLLTPTELRVDNEVISMDRVTKIALKPITKLRSAAFALLSVALVVIYFVKAALPFLAAVIVEINIAVDPKLEAKRQELNDLAMNALHTTIPANPDDALNYFLLWVFLLNLVFAPALALLFKSHLLVVFNDGTSREFFYRLAMYLPQSRFLSAARKLIKKRIKAEKKAAKRALKSLPN